MQNNVVQNRISHEAKRVLLIILDGWGETQDTRISAIAQANKPFFDRLESTYPHSTLRTDGEYVGLPEGQMGNSEVGHMHIGAGRRIYQDLVKVTRSFNVPKEDSESIYKNPVFQELVSYAKKNNKPVHLMGLLSDGGVHSCNDHFYGMVKALQEEGVSHVYIHAFTDGRDTDPKSGKGFLQEALMVLEKHNATLATVMGRFYGMDRDKRWERVQEAYDALLYGKGEQTQNVLETVQMRYDRGETDEFLQPIICVATAGDALPQQARADVQEDRHSSLSGSEQILASESPHLQNSQAILQPVAVIQDGDVVIHMNFRSDRARELTHIMTQLPIDIQEAKKSGASDIQIAALERMKPLHLHYVCMAPYDESFQDIAILFPKEVIADTLAETISKNGKTQLHIAETEKYAHVTFFFAGGREEKFPGEDRILCPSPKIATYDLQPAMSAGVIADAFAEYIEGTQNDSVQNSEESLLEAEEPSDIAPKRDVAEKGQPHLPDFVVLNFANADMVGHTGVLEAAIEAIEAVDKALEKILNVAQERGYEVMIIADHGNADHMKNHDGTPNTQHSMNPVPCIYIAQDTPLHLQNGELIDVAPTILQRMGITIPAVMTGKNLLDDSSKE